MNYKQLILATLLPSSALLLVGCSSDVDSKGEPPSAEAIAVGNGDDNAGPAAQLKPVGSRIDVAIAPLAVEETGNVATLPAQYPEDWILVDEVSFASMFGGKIIILDSSESKPEHRIKGIMDKSLIGNFTQHPTRPELYIMESFHERGSRGKRTDVLAIYDKTTLNIIKEIVWTETTRLQALPERYSMAVSGNGEFLYVANFSPAASFTVVDLERQESIATVSTPGCVLTYPTGKNSVTSICSNGGLLTSVLNNDGTLRSQQRIKSFFHSDTSPIFERPAIIDGIAYFPSFDGEMHEVDMHDDVAKYLGSWDMLSEEERAANWRPSGLSLTSKDSLGRFYTIMQPDGHEGSHQHGGTHVWLFDAKAKKRVKIIETPNWAISIGVTQGNNPKLIVTNGELALDVYSTEDGSLIHTMSDFGSTTPLLIHKSY